MGSLFSYLALYTALSFISNFVCFFLPGFYVTHTLRLRMSVASRFVLASVIGIALFGMQAYINGWLGIRFFSYVYLFIAIGIGIRFHKSLLLFLNELVISALRANKLFIGLVFLGVVLQSIQMFGNGLPGAEGTRFWRTNAFDGIYHIGLIESMKREFPPIEPSSSKQPVINYHFWSDLVLSEQSRLFTIPPTFLFFQWWPVLISLLTSIAVIEFVQVLTKSQSHTFSAMSTVFALLLLHLGSDAGWLLYWWVHRSISFAYPAIDNGPTQFLNMPHTFGKLFFFVIGLVFLFWKKEKKWSLFGLALFLSAVSIGLKIYFGFALAIGWMGIFIGEAIQKALKEGVTKKHLIRYFGVLILIGALYTILVASIYLPVNKSAGGLSWYPLEWPNLLINRNNIDWTNLAIRIGIARYEQNQLKIILFNVVLIGVGLLAIHGTRAVGFLVTKRTLKLFGKEGFLFFYLPVIVCTFLGFTTLQVSGGFNVFNFFVVSLCILSVNAAVVSAELFERNAIIGAAVICGILLLSIPRTVYETSTMVSHYSDKTDSVLVSSQDLEAFTFVRTLPKESIILAPLDHPLESKSTYIGAFTGKQSYFSGKYLLETHNEPFQEKEKNASELFNQSSPEEIQEKAFQMGVTHIVIDSTHLSSPAEQSLFSRKETAVFGNGRVFVYDVRNL